jgi:hypothetical protein
MPVKAITICLIAIVAIIPIDLFAKQLSIPFTSQAPKGNWHQPWQDDCEEATILMVDKYYANQSLTSETAIAGLHHIRKLKESLHGFSLDENAEKVTSVINNFLTWEARSVVSPTLESLKLEVDAGRPIIIPTYGKALGNPYFRNGGPEYHTVVVSGYDDVKQEFITQEPGTRHGVDFRYKYATIMNAMHDYVPSVGAKNGPRVAIFTKRTIDTSSGLDGDRDGLNKRQEMLYGSVLWLADSDGDGYNDGQEVTNGYSPVRKPYQRRNGDLIKSSESPAVYIIENGLRRHIASEFVFIRGGYNWKHITTISQRDLSSIQEGAQIVN